MRKTKIMGSLFLTIGFLIGTSCMMCRAEKNHYFSKTVEDIAPFHTLHVTGTVEVDLVQRPSVVVRISGPEQEVLAADVHMEKDTLFVGASSSGRGHKNLRVHIAAPAVWQVKISQEAEVKIVGAYEVVQFSLALQEQSDFSADRLRTHGLTISVADKSEAEINRIDAHTVKANATGQGEIELSGLAQLAILENEGTGKIDAADLRVQRGSASVKNKGDIKIAAYEALTAAVFGRGKVLYKGEPVHMERSGNLKRILPDND